MSITEYVTELNRGNMIGTLLVSAAVLAVILSFVAVPVVAAGEAAPPNGQTIAEIDNSVETDAELNTSTETNAEVNGSVETDEGTNITILQYNDIQTAMADNRSIGTLVGAINDRKAATDNPTIVVGGGDEVSPSSLSAVSQWEVPIDALNVLNPAAEVIGNHDLDYGFEPVAEFSEQSEFPWLVANIQADDGGNIPGTQNYTVVERDGVTVGILGLVDDAIDPKTEVDFEEEGYEVTDWSKAGSEVATTLEQQENVDVVVALAHTGIPESREIANNTDNIDVIVTGDDEVLYEPKVTSGTVIVEAGGEATHLGEVNLSVTEDDVGFNDGRLYNLEEGNWSTNESADDVVQAGRSEDLGTVAGESTAPLDSTLGNYADDTGWGRIIGDAFIAQTDADLAMTNAGGIRGNFIIEEGELTYDDIYTSLPFGNTLVTKSMTGEQIIEYLSQTTSPIDGDFGAQPELQVAGLTYEMVDNPDASQKVTDVYVHGEPIQMSETYEVTVNSFMAGGPMLSDIETVDEDLTLYGTAVVNYVEQQGTVTPPDEDRIRRTTRTLNEPAISADGETVTLEYAVPGAVESINESSFTILNETSSRLGVNTVELADGNLSVSVDKTELLTLSEGSDMVEFYGTYSDQEIDDDRNGWDNSRLNGDAKIPQERIEELRDNSDESGTDDGSDESGTDDGSDESGTDDGSDESGTDDGSDESGTDDGSDESGTDDGSETNSDSQDSESNDGDSNGPGFTLLITVLTILGVALLVANRRE